MGTESSHRSIKVIKHAYDGLISSTLVPYETLQQLHNI